MRRVAFFLFIAVILAGCTGVQTLSPDKLAPYESSQHGFSISYPEGWSVHPNPDEVFAVQFESYGESIQVTPRIPSEMLSLKELAGTFVSGFKDELAEVNGGKLSVVFDGATVVHGYAAHAVVLEVEGDVGVKVKAVVIQSKKYPGQIYAVTVVAPKNVYVRNSATYDAAVESFQEN